MIAETSLNLKNTRPMKDFDNFFSVPESERKWWYVASHVTIAGQAAANGDLLTNFRLCDLKNIPFDYIDGIFPLGQDNDI